MINHPLQLKAFESVAAALPFKIDRANIEIEHGPSYTISPVKAHDYAAGVMASMGATVEHLGPNSWTAVADAETEPSTFTPSMVFRHPMLMGVDPDTTGWDAVSGTAPIAQHYPTRLAREWGFRNLVSCYGIEDRVDGGGASSLA